MEVQQQAEFDACGFQVSQCLGNVGIMQLGDGLQFNDEPLIDQHINPAFSERAPLVLQFDRNLARERYTTQFELNTHRLFVS